MTRSSISLAPAPPANRAGDPGRPPAAKARRRVAGRMQWLAIGSVALAGPLLAGSGNQIAVSSTASPAYVRALDAQGRPQPETYVFTKGHFLGSGTADSGISKISFPEVLANLAPNLAKQNYFPTKDVGRANLVIVVHWGTTLVYDDPQKAFAIEGLSAALKNYSDGVQANGSADAGTLNTLLGQQANAQDGAQGAIARNAALLGYAHTLARERQKIMPGTEEYTMSEELNEERYFVVLMAYDYQFMKREHRPRLLWVTRLSLRSPGNNFAEALPALSHAGGDVFGRQIDDLVRVRVPAQRGQVKLDELKVLGSFDDPPAAPPGK